jgi:hypothetical protein
MGPLFRFDFRLQFSERNRFTRVNEKFASSAGARLASGLSIELIRPSQA